MRMRAVLVGSVVALLAAGGVTTASAMVAPDMPESTPSVTADPSVAVSATPTPSEAAVTLTPAVTPTPSIVWSGPRQPGQTAQPVPGPVPPRISGSLLPPKPSPVMNVGG